MPDAVEPFAGNALHNSLYGNHPQAAALLVKKGINLRTLGAHGDVPAMVWAGYSDVGDTTVARLLLERHVPVTAENEAVTAGVMRWRPGSWKTIF